MRHFAGVLLSVVLPTAASADQDVVFEMMRRTMDIEGSSQELAVHISGMQECKLDGLMKIDDVNLIGNAYRKADVKAFEAGSLKGAMIVKGLELKPGSEHCKVVKQKIEESLPDYEKTAAAVRKLGLR